MHARQGTTSHPEQICLIRFTWGGSVEDLGKWSSSDGAHLLPFHLALPTTSPHLAGPPRAWGLDWGEAGGRQVLEGADRSWKGLRGAEQARREGEVAETRTTPSQETDGGRDRDSETERR